jgi:ribosomal protein S18 acetylase RimI-like enzyme
MANSRRELGCVALSPMAVRARSRAASDDDSMGDRALTDVIEVRARDNSDLEGCIALTRVVHDVDRYPLILQANIGDFLASPRLVAAWVARRGGLIVGHVALHRGSSRAMASMVSEALSVEPDGIGVVSRLMVSPSVRRSGVGRRLLDTAASAAARRGLTPALDVVTSYAAAIALYERAGWQRIGTITVAMPDGDEVDEYVYVGPS